MEMGGAYMPELHVAQQRRRDKLRVQQVEDYQGNNFHHHRHHHNNNSSLVYPSEMLNFAAGSQLSAFANIHPSRFHEPASSDSCDPQPLQICDNNWVTINSEDHERRNLIMSQWAAYLVSNPPITAEASAAHQYFHNNVHNWEDGGSELPLLPSFFSQAGNDASAQHQAQNHALSLSLSSNQIGEMHINVGEPRELKPFESGSISSVVKLDPTAHNQMQVVVESSNHNVARNVGPLGPFTGYTTILKSSKFLKPAQQILEEFLSASGLRNIRVCDEVDSVGTSRSLNGDDDSPGVLASKLPSSNDLSASRGTLRPEFHEKKAKLIHMQEEVCKRHKQYHQQMEMVMSAFDAVPGLSNATPYISRSVRTISRHFRCLKNIIADQIKVIKRALGEDLSSPTSYVRRDSCSSRLDHDLPKVKYCSIGGTSYGAHQNHVWRPQRGLPERAVTILRAWLFDHFLHPYPTDSDKQMLASQTGLSRNQVSNWFINARVRLWKPMVEEIHTLETKAMGRSETNVNSRLAAGDEDFITGCKPSMDAVRDTKLLNSLGSRSGMEGPSRGEMNTEQLLQKCSRMEHHHQIPTSIDGSLITFLPYQRRGLELGGIGPVSLTLGLRQGSETSNQQQLQHPFQHQGMHYGAQVMHEYSG